MTLIINDIWEEALEELGKPDVIITPVGTSEQPDFQASSFRKSGHITEQLKEKDIGTVLFTGWHADKALEAANRQRISDVFCEAGCVSARKVGEEWKIKTNVYDNYAKLMDEGAGRIIKTVVEEVGKSDRIAMNIQPDLVSMNFQTNTVAYCAYVNPPKKVYDDDLSEIINFQKKIRGAPKIKEAEIQLDLSDEVIGQTVRDLSRLFNFQPLSVRKDGEKIYMKLITEKKAIEIADNNKVTPEYLDAISKDCVKDIQRDIKLHGISEKSPHVVTHGDNCFDVFPYSKALAVLDASVDRNYKRVVLIEKGSGHESGMNEVFGKYGGIKAAAFCPSGLPEDKRPSHSIPVPGTETGTLYKTVGMCLTSVY